jgi:hypothetical protein
MLYSILRKLSKVALLLSVVFLSKISFAALSDIKFGQYQIADSQWNVNACLNTTTCEIYSKQPGVAYKIPWYNGQVQWAAGDYVKLELSGDSNYPYVARQYTSAGVLKETLGTGKIVNMGPDYFFFVGNDNNTGQLFSGSSGMSNTSRVTWTGTLNPTIAQADAYSDQNYSTTPLSPGQTASPPPPPPPPPTPVYSSGITTQQQTRKINNLNLNPLGHNAQVNILGDDNIVNIQQIGGRHFVAVDVQSSVNNVEILQTSTVGARHYMEARVVGSNNDLVLHQRDTSKTQFVEVLGNNNSVTAHQRGTGSHYLDVRIAGDNHTAGILQDGSGSHRATVYLDGSQPWNFNLNQNGSTGQTYSLPHTMSDGSAVSGTCSAIGGCNLTINQQ